MLNAKIKRLCGLMVITTMMLATRIATAQDIYVGAYGGMNFATASADENVSLSSRKGFLVGGRTELALTDALRMRVGAEYLQSGADYMLTTPGFAQEDGTYKFDYLTIPISLKLQFELSKTTPYVFAGVTPAAVVSATKVFTGSAESGTDGSGETNVKSELKGGDVAFDLGAGVDFPIGKDKDWAPYVEATYSYGLLDQKKGAAELLQSSSWRARNLKLVVGLNYKIF